MTKPGPEDEQFCKHDAEEAVALAKKNVAINLDKLIFLDIQMNLTWMICVVVVSKLTIIMSRHQKTAQK